MVNTAFALKFTTPCKLASKCGIYHLCFWFPPTLHFFAPSKFALIQVFVHVKVGGKGVMGRQQEFIFAKKLHWPTSSYNFNIGYNFTFVYFGCQLVAVKARYFLSSITGPYWTLNNRSRGKTLQLNLFAEAEQRETKLTVSLTDQPSISDLLYSCKFWSWKCNSALLPSDVIHFATLLAQGFWRETVSMLDVMWNRSNQWERAR